MRRFLIPLLIFGLVTTACGTTTDEKATTAKVGVVKVSALEAHGIISAPPADLVVLDVRTPVEFDEGHLANAVNIDFNAPDFSANLANIDKTVPYVLYCHSGNRSARAAEQMRSLGFTEVYEIDGGILSWVDNGLPLANPS